VPQRMHWINSANLLNQALHKPMNNEDQPINLSCYRNESEWIKAVAAEMAQVLEQSLQHNSHARMLLSGGTTPAPVYAELARQPLNWEAVIVGLADERCVPADNPNSNAYLIGEHLLKSAKSAQFQPLFVPDQSLDECVQAANLHIQQYPPPCLLVLGMGNDGHTSSLFPGSIDLDSALSSQQVYTTLDATGCPVAGDFPQRITLTTHGLAVCQTRLLLLRGQQKMDVLEAAYASGDVRQYPILAAINAPGQRLRVHWCA